MVLMNAVWDGPEEEGKQIFQEYVYQHESPGLCFRGNS